MRPLRVLTWHVHGNYLLYLSRAGVEFVLPVDPARGAGYGGRGATFPFGPNVVEVPADRIRSERFDCVLFQTRQNWEHDQHDILSPAQRRLPRIFAREWERTFADVAGRPPGRSPAVPVSAAGAS